MELTQLYEAILNGKLEEAVAVTNEALAAGIAPQTLINDYMIKGMEEIGARFEHGKAFVPNLLMSARAMKGSLDILKPLLKGDTSATLGKIVIGTVKGDLHDIGKNLVASMLEGCGFEVVNLGVDIAAERFIEAARDEKADIICMSALLTTTMTYMKEVIEAVRKAGLNVKIMVGGAPVNEAFARSIGADGYSSNANAAVVLAKSLIQA
ncbi:corrinoid protein [Alistipes sp.]|uniref:corrinoid protein n=1 Tax=Alistipes sp. TaxID=1872444 RepID=UPI0025BEABE0|nr:corrinoid protein [Alistipes sp.]